MLSSQSGEYWSDSSSQSSCIDSVTFFFYSGKFWKDLGKERWRNGFSAVEMGDGGGWTTTVGDGEGWTKTVGDDRGWVTSVVSEALGGGLVECRDPGMPTVGDGG